MPMNNHENLTVKDTDPLVPLAEYRRSGQCPIELHHAIFYHRESLENAGAICRYGRRWLVSPSHLMKWLRQNGKQAGRTDSSNKSN